MTTIGGVGLFPDAGYRRSTRRLWIAAWIAAVVLASVALLLAGSYPLVGALVFFLSLGALRIAAEVRDEMNGWDQ